MSIDPNHRGNSKEVARRLAEVLIDAHAQPAEIPYIDDLGWRLVVLCASERTRWRDGFKHWNPPRGYTPSPETRNRVHKFVSMGRTTIETPDDPFEGLPS